MATARNASPIPQTAPEPAACRSENAAEGPQSWFALACTDHTGRAQEARVNMLVTRANGPVDVPWWPVRVPTESCRLGTLLMKPVTQDRGAFSAELAPTW